MSEYPTIEGFEVLKELGRGGMATVYKAQDLHLQNNVAIKVIRVDDSTKIEERESLLEREVRNMRRIDGHANIIRVHQYTSRTERGGDKPAYIVMELAEGGSLADYIQRIRRFNPEASLPVIRQIADAIAYANENDIYHRDLKPGNILLTAGGRPLISDFDSAASRTDCPSIVGKMGMGTLGYLAPEVLEHAQDPDFNPPFGPVEVYGVGATWYHMLTGEAPVHSDGRTQMIVQSMTQEGVLEKIANLEVPEKMKNVLQKSMEARAENRFETVREMANAIDHLVNSQRLPEQTSVETVQPKRKAEPWNEPTPKWYHLIEAGAIGFALGLGTMWAAQNFVIPWFFNHGQ